MTLLPTIDDATLEELTARIKPVFRFVTRENYQHVLLDVDDEGYANADLLYVELPKDLRGMGINRQPIPEKPTGKLTELARVETHHTVSSMLNPSVAEVLAQIPKEYIDSIVAFEVIHRFPCEVVHEGMNSYHKTTTILYEQAE